MAKELEEFSFESGRGTYAWDTWFNGNPWRLEAGEDFTVKVASFKGAALAAAKTRGGKLRTKVLDEKTIVIQFVKDE